MSDMKPHRTQHNWLLNPGDAPLRTLVAGFVQEVRDSAGRQYGDFFDEVEEKNRLEKSETVRQLRMEVARLLAETSDPEIDYDIAPSDLRLFVFRLLWKSGKSFITSETDLFNPSADEMIHAAAAHFGLDEETIRSRFHADIPEERRIQLPAVSEPAEIVRMINARRLRQKLRSASSLVVRMPGSIGTGSPYVSIFWMLKRLGLMYEAREDGAEIVLNVTGPLALFEKTTVYGNRFGSFVIHVLHGFEGAGRDAVRIEAAMNNERVKKPGARRISLLLDSSYAAYFARPGSQIDEKLLRSGDESAFQKYFQKAAPGWTITYEGAVLPLRNDAGEHAGIFIPDFVLSDEKHSRKILVELVGYWREEYLKRKIETMKLLRGREVYFFINAQLQAGGATEDLEKQVSPDVKLRYYSGRRDLKRAVQEMAGEIGSA
jgi:uncharacterized protein